jgi:hypothetical protein
MLPSTTSKVTIDHDEIRRWAEVRGAKPAAVAAESGDDPGILRLDFPGDSDGDSREAIGWDEWFRKFDRNNLALLYQEQVAGGERSNFNKLVRREVADEVASAVGGRGRSAVRRGSSRGRPSARPTTKSSASPPGSGLPGTNGLRNGQAEPTKESVSARGRASSGGRSGSTTPSCHGDDARRGSPSNTRPAVAARDRRSTRERNPVSQHAQ